MPDSPPKSPRALTDPSIASAKALRERQSQPQAVPVGEFDEEDNTERHDLETLEGKRAVKQLRASRTTEQRLEKLEDKHDRLDRTVAKMSGQMDGQDKVLENIERSIANLSAREHVTFTAQVDVEKNRAIENAKAPGQRRDLAIKIVALLGTIGTLVLAVLHARSC